MQMTWQRILERSPEMAGLRSDAESIARNEKWSWYERWLPNSTIFIKACRTAAARLGVEPYDVRPVALAALVDAYRVAKAKLQRNLQPARTRPPDSRERGRKFVSRDAY